MEEPGEDCPACGEPLFAWVLTRGPAPEAAERVVDRCESCGLAVVRSPHRVDVDAELAARERPDGAGGVILRSPNRRSLQAGIGEGRWALLDPTRRLHLTPEAAGLLLERRGLEVASIRYPLAPRTIASMWQTLMNAFTLNHNFASEARAGRLHPRDGRGPVAFWIDAVASVAGLLPVGIFALPLELIGKLARRGGEMMITARPIREQAGREPEGAARST